MKNDKDYFMVIKLKGNINKAFIRKLAAGARRMNGTTTVFRSYDTGYGMDDDAWLENDKARRCCKLGRYYNMLLDEMRKCNYDISSLERTYKLNKARLDTEIKIINTRYGIVRRWWRLETKSDYIIRGNKRLNAISYIKKKYDIKLLNRADINKVNRKLKKIEEYMSLMRDIPDVNDSVAMPRSWGGSINYSVS